MLDLIPFSVDQKIESYNKSIKKINEIVENQDLYRNKDGL